MPDYRGAEIMSESQIREQIAKLQAIQKTHKPSSSAWIVASELLEPLFAQMAIIAKNAVGKGNAY